MAAKPQPPTRIQNHGTGHVYYLDGDKVPGVTTILRNGIPKHLEGWAAGCTAEFVVNRLATARNTEGKVRIVADDLVREALEWNSTRPYPAKVSGSDALPRAALLEILRDVRYRDLDEASNRGTEVHKIAYRLALGETVDVPEAIAGHVRSYLRFLAEWSPRDADVERVLVNRTHRYMGRCDLIATFDRLPEWIATRIGRTAGRGLLDIKTSRSGIFAETALQLEGYRRCETMLDGDVEVPLEPVDFVAAIHVRADGYEVYAFDIETVHRPTTFEVFLFAKFVGEWLDFKDDNSPAKTIRSPALHLPTRTTEATS